MTNNSNIKENRMNIETLFCLKHNIPSYVNHDSGVTTHTCADCHPELIEKKVKKGFSIKNYGAHDHAAGGYCSDETLEMLMGNAFISVNMPPKAENDFYSDYLELTGKQSDGKHVYMNKDEQKYWYSTEVRFDWKEGMTFNTAMKVRRDGNKMVISSNGLGGYLFANGFELGAN